MNFLIRKYQNINHIKRYNIIKTTSMSPHVPLQNFRLSHNQKYYDLYVQEKNKNIYMYKEKFLQI